MSLIEAMLVLPICRQLETSNKRLWRIVHNYMHRMLGDLGLSSVTKVSVEEVRRKERRVR
ncbi:hypothetical protein [Halomonas dongshanensis]|uniref:DUF1127 domain-containing protein n=1 Tax=Halomonas dongshanensis TaxID=2890835 RepID=A0ABT2EFY4_9GAMM|nr:hypothetical protein [Halomonas dongshanensis]MCS2609529.1 hypothetical protein [Halomonas dongshanensis]